MRLALLSFVVAALSVQQAVSIPFDKRDAPAPAPAPTINDTTIAKFAITLEHLEEAFYTFGLNKFNDIAFLNQGYTPLVRQRFVEILAHEKDHVALLTTVLGDQTPKPCNYKFVLPDVRTFILISQVMEEIGTSAYIGAIQLLTSKDHILASSSILAIEANQATLVAIFASNGVPWGGSFKIPLTMKQAFSLASGFITSCPAKSDLTPFPPLKIDGAFPKTQFVFPGQKVRVKAPSKATHIAFLTGRTPVFVPIEDGNVTFPDNMSGQVYAVATSSATDASDDSTVAGPAILLFPIFSNFTLTN